MNTDYKLYRCRFVNETKEYIIGRDIFNNTKYYINKNNESKKFKIGNDNSFYANKMIVGLVFKKTILDPIEYEKIIKDK